MSDMSQVRNEEDESEEADGWELSDEAREQVELLENPELLQDDN